MDVILQSGPEDIDTQAINLKALIDNKALIKRLQRWDVSSISEVFSPEYDLLQASRGICQKALDYT